jgi:hypothetical protein
MACITSTSLVPVKGRRFANSSYSTNPNEKISPRASTFRPDACSGDIYATVPRIVPGFVVPAVRVAPTGSVDSAVSSNFANPKSASFAYLFFETRTFSGLMSLQLPLHGTRLEHRQDMRMVQRRRRLTCRKAPRRRLSALPRLADEQWQRRFQQEAQTVIGLIRDVSFT